MAPTRCCGEANTPPYREFGWEFRVPEPGFARVDPLRGRVSGLLQERESETIDHECIRRGHRRRFRPIRR